MFAVMQIYTVCGYGPSELAPLALAVAVQVGTHRVRSHYGSKGLKFHNFSGVKYWGILDLCSHCNFCRFWRFWRFWRLCSLFAALHHHQGGFPCTAVSTVTHESPIVISAERRPCTVPQRPQHWLLIVSPASLVGPLCTNPGIMVQRGKNWSEADSLKLIDAYKHAQEIKRGNVLRSKS